jgi:ComF family protein
LNDLSRSQITQNQIYRLFWKTVDFIYPPECASCGKPGALLCKDCKEKIQPLFDPICPICGYPVATPGVCQNCRDNPPPYTALRSWAEFEGSLRKALHKLKYESDLGLGLEFSYPLLQIIAKEKWAIDYIIPIPISKKHRKTRGYNQATIIARPLALALGIPLFEKSVSRVKETESQVNLSREERFKNLHSAFLGNSAKLLNKKVLLVDDVATTGATMISCSQTLREFGCAQVFCITVARTIKYIQ